MGLFTSGVILAALTIAIVLLLRSSARVLRRLRVRARPRPLTTALVLCACACFLFGAYRCADAPIDAARSYSCSRNAPFSGRPSIGEVQRAHEHRIEVARLAIGVDREEPDLLVKPRSSSRFGVSSVGSVCAAINPPDRNEMK